MIQDILTHMKEDILIYLYNTELTIAAISVISFLIAIIFSISFKKIKWYNKSILYIICILSPLSFLLFFEYNDPVIHYNNGLKFFNGDKYSINKDTAIKAFEKAAKYNHIESCRLLGGLYKSEDVYKTVNYWKKGTYLGDRESAKLLADLYYDNIFISMTIEDRLESAYMAYYQAVCLGDNDSRNRLQELQAMMPESVQKKAKAECLKITAERK